MTQINNNGIGSLDGAGKTPSKADLAKTSNQKIASGSGNTTDSTAAANLAGQILTQANVNGAIHRGNETNDAGAFEGLAPDVQAKLNARANPDAAINLARTASKIPLQEILSYVGLAA